jgi:hypothetical protein
MACGKFSVGKGGILLPMDDGAKAITSKVGETFDVEITYDRDMVYHRRVMVTIGDLAKAVGQTPEWLRAQLLVYCGLFHIVGDLDGKHVIAVTSMSRHSMRDEELHHFWEDAKEHVITRVLPLIQNETVRDRLHTAVTAF